MDYVLLEVDTVAAYIAAHPVLSSLVDPHTVDAVEIGDGNLNLVFVCTDASGRSLVLKQSLPYVRVAPDWELTADRSTHEWIGLREAFAASPATAPEPYSYDEPRHIVAMEDLSGMHVWRTALDRGDIAEGADEQVARHVARLGFATSAHGRIPQEMRRGVAAATNPELCDITEELVFIEPLVEHEHNEFADELAADVDRIRSNRALVDAVLGLKQQFLSETEVLLHGDLHTGSIMVGDDGGVKVFDTEFGAYGPVGFDLGMFVANLVFAHARAEVLGRTQQAAWLAEAPGRVAAAYAEELSSLWPTRVDPRVSDAILASWLARAERQAVGFAGCEAIRRIVGFAKVSDIETLDADAHLTAARSVLGHAERLLVDPPSSLAEVLHA